MTVLLPSRSAYFHPSDMSVLVSFFFTPLPRDDCDTCAEGLGVGHTAVGPRSGRVERADVAPSRGSPPPPDQLCAALDVALPRPGRVDGAAAPSTPGGTKAFRVHGLTHCLTHPSPLLHSPPARSRVPTLNTTS